MPTVNTDINALEMRGLVITAKGAQIKRFNKVSYSVRSQTNGQWYSVVKHYGNSIERTKAYWTCTCPDQIYRKSQCKHICAVLYSKDLRREVLRRTARSQDVAEVITEVSTSVNQVEQSQVAKIICPKCKGVDTVKDGVRHTKDGRDIQRYSCKDCHVRFIINSGGFERARADAKVITAALDLYFKGVSLRKVCDHLKQFYGLVITHVAVIKWIRKFVKVVKPYVDQIEAPHLSGIYHVDEMMVHVRKEKTEKGHYQWLWNLDEDLCGKTRAEGREIKIEGYNKWKTLDNILARSL